MDKSRIDESGIQETKIEETGIEKAGMQEADSEEDVDEADADEEGFYRWGHGNVGGYYFRDAVAIEVHLEAFEGEPRFEDPELRRILFERAVDDRELRACCVLPDGLRLLYDRTADLLLVLWSLRIQTEEYAELFGAPEGKVWGDALRLRPLDTQEEVVAAAAAVLRLPTERGLAEGDAPYDFVTSTLHDVEGRPR